MLFALYNSILHSVSVWMVFTEMHSVNVYQLVLSEMPHVILVFHHHVLQQMFVLCITMVLLFVIHVLVQMPNLIRAVDQNVFQIRIVHSIKPV